MLFLASPKVRPLRPLVGIAVALVAIAMLPSEGCSLCDGIDSMTLRGTVVDLESGSPAVDAVLGIRSFTAGVETYFSPPFIFNGSPDNPPPDAEGRFTVFLSTGLLPCDGPQVFPRPDRIELIVARGGCEQSIFIDINEQTVVDIAFPNDVIELRDPVQVPPCPAEAAP